MFLLMSNIFQISTNPNEELENIYAQAMVDLNDFFQIKWVRNRPKVCVVPNRETIDALRDQETPKWLVGWDSDNFVFVLSKSSFETDSSHPYTDEDYKMLIKHELAHAYFRIATGGRTQPKWLWEGVSILASGQVEKWKKPEAFKTFLDNNDVYTEAGYALSLLTNKFGKEKLIQLLKGYKSFSGDFSNIFRDVYQLELNYDTFNSLIQK